MSHLFRFLYLIAFAALFIIYKFLPGLVILSFIVCPLTWLYSRLTDNSYNFVIDQSRALYFFNKVAWVSGVVILSWFLTKNLFNLDSFLNIF